jgi:hypothetical protein
LQDESYQGSKLSHYSNNGLKAPKPSSRIRQAKSHSKRERENKSQLLNEMLKAKGGAVTSSITDSIETYQKHGDSNNMRASKELKSLIKKQRSMSAVSEKMSQQSQSRFRESGDKIMAPVTTNGGGGITPKVIFEAQRKIDIVFLE